jgi:RNA polymerase sigma factor (sigma-70 family)
MSYLTGIDDNLVKLTKKEAAALHREGTPEAYQKLVLSVSPWAIHLASKYFETVKEGISKEELISCALMGVIEAVPRWTPARSRLITCATWYIRKHLYDYTNIESRILHIPKTALEKRTSPACSQACEKAKYVGSLDANSVTQTRLKNEPPDPSQRCAIDIVADTELAVLQKEFIHTHFKKLLPNRQAVLRLRARGYTLKVIADEMGLTRERVRQLQNDAIQHLQFLYFRSQKNLLYVYEETPTQVRYSLKTLRRKKTKSFTDPSQVLSIRDERRLQELSTLEALVLSKFSQKWKPLIPKKRKRKSK